MSGTCALARTDGSYGGTAPLAPSAKAFLLRGLRRSAFGLGPCTKAFAEDVGFVELALSGAPIHWARILWKATRQHAFEEKGGSINHLSPFLINFYRSMGCLTASERVQFPLLSCSNPGRYVKDVEVDTGEDEMPACTPPAQPRAKEVPRAARVPRKRKWEGEAEQSQQRDAAAPNRKRTMQELCSRPKQKARRLVLPASSAETGRAAERRNSPSSGEDASARAKERSADLPAPKARTEARRPSGQGYNMRHRRMCRRRTGASPPSKYQLMTRLRIKSLRRRRGVRRSLRLNGLQVKRLQR
ncbi:hypothetical protein AXG93_4492s1320 [Marchantia polymorpha subsp. ruderalis]|uniref:Uncharacterized protein n=1 Tax=Marchantia polymorpha subsp. ruderalis TaxID=1480154 RepID=A0A176W6K7_MARPO|nr:hypothetical protein AXG93_4492s1320 [Marchantia polymorpha subsp. ruderalis]